VRPKKKRSIEYINMETKKIVKNTMNEEENESWLSPEWLTGTCIDIETRAGIVDWLIQCQQYLGLSDNCLHIAVANLDLALSNVEDWDVGEVQLLALAALQLAAKLTVDAPPTASLLVPLAGGVYSVEDLARTELELLASGLDWNLRELTACDFLHLYAEAAGKGRRPLFRMANAILDQCLYQEWYGCQKPSWLAASCLAAAIRLTSGQNWCDQLTEITGHTFADTQKGSRLCLTACTSSQREGFLEKHGKSGRNLGRLQVCIRDLIRGA